MFAGSVTLVMGAPPEVDAKEWVPAEFDVRLTAVAVVVVVALPKTSWRVTVNELVAEAPAVPLNVLTPSCVPFNAVMVSCWVPEVRPVAAAVMVGFPALVSP